MPRQKLEGAFKHDAAKLALEAIGRPAKTAEIEKVLLDSGYGQDIDNFTNSLFTAMNRKEDMFRKPARGTWALVEWGESEDGETDEEAQ